MRAFNAGAWRTPDAGQIRVSGAWRSVTKITGYIGGAWRDVVTFVQPLTASASISDVSGFAVGPSDAFVTTETVTVTPSGGQGPYTYAWTRTSGSGSANAPASATTSFTDFVAVDAANVATFQCLVTDSLGTTTTVSVGATFANSSIP